MIIEAAIGDAYGAGFEFRKDEFIKTNNTLTTYHSHGLYTEIYKKYTDDTQMAIANAELLLEDDDWTQEKVADKFVEVFHRDIRRGYSNRVYDALYSSKTGKDFLKTINNQSTGNGAAMRAYSLGYIRHIDQLKAFVEIQAKTSHNTKEGITGALRIALAVHYYLYVNEGSLIEFLDETIQEKGNYQIVSPIDMHSYPTTNAVIPLVIEATSMQSCLQKGIDYGGDTDTVAEMSMAILSVKKGVVNDLPSFLYDELENGKYGRDYLVTLDRKLQQKFGF